MEEYWEAANKRALEIMGREQVKMLCVDTFKMPPVNTLHDDSKKEKETGFLPNCFILI